MFMFQSFQIHIHSQQQKHATLLHSLAMALRLHTDCMQTKRHLKFVHSAAHCSESCHHPTLPQQTCLEQLQLHKFVCIPGRHHLKFASPASPNPSCADTASSCHQKEAQNTPAVTPSWSYTAETTSSTSELRNEFTDSHLEFEPSTEAAEECLGTRLCLDFRPLQRSNRVLYHLSLPLAATPKCLLSTATSAMTPHTDMYFLSSHTDSLTSQASAGLLPTWAVTKSRLGQVDSEPPRKAHQNVWVFTTDLQQTIEC